MLILRISDFKNLKTYACAYKCCWNKIGNVYLASSCIGLCKCISWCGQYDFVDFVVAVLFWLFVLASHRHWYNEQMTTHLKTYPMKIHHVFFLIVAKNRDDEKYVAFFCLCWLNVCVCVVQHGIGIRNKWQHIWKPIRWKVITFFLSIGKSRRSKKNVAFFLSGSIECMCVCGAACITQINLMC